MTNDESNSKGEMTQGANGVGVGAPGRGLPGHHLKIMLVEPEIPQNTGNIARLCAVTGVELHLVRPLGFFLTEKYLKRAGMDYWERVKLTVHDDLAAARRVLEGKRYWLASARRGKVLWEVDFAGADWIVGICIACFHVKNATFL